jgi:hypothetical protein
MAKSQPVLWNISERQTNGGIAMNAKATLAQGQELFKLVLQSGIGKDALQDLLESGKFTALLKEFMGQIITRSVRIDRTRTPKNAIKATGKVEGLLADSVVKTMPAGGDGIENDVEVVFFNLGRYASDDEVAAEFAKHGIEPDPYAVMAVNEADPEFSHIHPNATHWKDADGNWCNVVFDIEVSVRRGGYGFDGRRCWFGGVRKAA